MLERIIVASIKIEERVHELSVVMSAAAMTDQSAAAAWRDRLDTKRAAYRRVVSRTKDEGHLSSAWSIDEVVDLLVALTSVDSYHQLVVERGWKPHAVTRKVWEICERTLLIGAEHSPTGTPARRKR